MRFPLAIAILAAGCYEPRLAPCKVSCGSAADCAQGDACGTDGFCVAVAGDRCTSEGPGDATIAMPLALHVTVMGNGSVTVTDGGTCKDTCMYTFAQGVAITAMWIQTSGGHAFSGWTTPNCLTQGQTCTFTLAPTTAMLGARFQ
jgi:hypothetical protein